MIVGEVIGNLWATKKEEKLNGFRFLAVRELDYLGEKTSKLLIAADSIGAGMGDKVLIAGGSSARVGLGDKNIPIDAIIVGIVDTLEINA